MQYIQVNYMKLTENLTHKINTTSNFEIEYLMRYKHVQEITAHA